MKLLFLRIAFGICSLAAMIAAVPAASGAQPGRNGVGGGTLQTVGPRVAVPLGGPWQEFSFTTAGVDATACGGCTPSSGGNSTFPGNPPWTFTCPEQGCLLTVTDAFLNGDQFDVFDNAGNIGATSVVSATGSCAGDGSDPAICSTDPNSSHRVFILGAGPHSLTIRPNTSPFNGGAAYFRIDPAPITVPTLSGMAMICMAILLVGFGLWSIHRRRSSHHGRAAA